MNTKAMPDDSEKCWPPVSALPQIEERTEYGLENRAISQIECVSLPGDLKVENGG